ncbi:hypothetical protein DVH05_004108 [Phytophthora capsici]|nr:hypothetical protein DVH05_004108 [Phytophthora capsici]
MVKSVGNPNYKAAEINRLLALVEEYLPLRKDEWDRLATSYNSSRTRGWVERDLDSLRRKFKVLYSTRKSTDLPDMPPRIKHAKLLKQAIDDKANVIEMDDKPDEDGELGDEGQYVVPDFGFGG